MCIIQIDFKSRIVMVIYIYQKKEKCFIIHLFLVTLSIPGLKSSNL